jgi:hypothetical protein
VAVGMDEVELLPIVDLVLLELGVREGVDVEIV